MTLVRLGSENPVKCKALSFALEESRRFTSLQVEGIPVPSQVSDQPIGFEETIEGARNRARGAFASGCDLGVGIESGLIPVPRTRSGYMNLTACVLHDGRDFFTGLGPAFELPDAVKKGVFEKGMELDDAVSAAGLTENPRIGYAEGLIGILTDQVVTRMRYTVPAIQMALAGLPRQTL